MIFTLWKSRLNKYGLPDRVLVTLLVLSLLSTIAELAGIGMFIPIFEILKNGDFLNSVNEDKDGVIKYLFFVFDYLNIEHSLEYLLFSTFLFFSISKAFLFLVGYINSFYSGVLIKNSRDNLLKMYLNCDSSYYDKVGIADFINKSTVELPAAVHGVLSPIKFVVSILMALGSIILLFIISYQLTILSVTIIIISLMYPYRWVKATVGAGKRNSQYNSVITSFLLDRLRSPRLIRLSGVSNSENTEYSVITEKQRKLTLIIHLLKARVDLVLEPAVIGVSLVMLYFSISVLELEFSMIMLYLIVMVRLLPIIKGLINQRQVINRSEGPVESMNSVLKDMEKSVKIFNKYNSGNLSLKKEDVFNIELKEIFFTYKNKDKQVLKNINLKFRRSTLNAIVGPSGGGKSTLIDIIARYRVPTAGSIFINGRDGDTMQLSVSFVPQELQIFSGTIAEHISYGSKMCNKSMVNVAKLSGAYDFIMELPDKFDTQLVENSRNLSGGQKQRIDLARALFKNSQLLILDEPTGNLDTLSESVFMKTIDNIRKETNKIIIIVAHRLNTIKGADQIVVLEGGMVTGIGSHSEVFIKNSWYKESIDSGKTL
jgi:ATP-binding cassette, subfamily B, bacterial